MGYEQREGSKRKDIEKERRKGRLMLALLMTKKAKGPLWPLAACSFIFVYVPESELPLFQCHYCLSHPSGDFLFTSARSLSCHSGRHASLFRHGNRCKPARRVKCRSNDKLLSYRTEVLSVKSLLGVKLFFFFRILRNILWGTT